MKKSYMDEINIISEINLTDIVKAIINKSPKFSIEDTEVLSKKVKEKNIPQKLNKLNKQHDEMRQTLGKLGITVQKQTYKPEDFF
jgi:N-dimethylarginine dimethylaminohydrolase